MLSVFINGSYFEKENATISAFDISVTRSVGVYEGITALKDKIFRLKDHLDRLRKSAAALGIMIRYSDEEMEKAMLYMMENTKYPRSEIRMYATGGPTIDSINFDPANSTLIISVDQHMPFPAKLFEDGAKLIAHEHMRFMPEYKTINYIEGVLMQKERVRQGAIEVLYFYEGKALECSTSNFGAVAKGVLVIPKNNLLLGITRKVVLEIAKREGVAFDERDLTMEELRNAEEVMIFSSYKDVMPVTDIDGHKVGNGKVGAISRKLVFDFRKELGYSV